MQSDRDSNQTELARFSEIIALIGGTPTCWFTQLRPHKEPHNRFMNVQYLFCTDVIGIVTNRCQIYNVYMISYYTDHVKLRKIV